MSPRPHLAHWPARLPQELEAPETSLWFNLEVAAQRYPHKSAYLYLGRRLTWQELHRQAEALAGWLQARGVQRGDRVLLFMQNCPQYVVAAFAVLRANAVIVPTYWGQFCMNSSTRSPLCTPLACSQPASASAWRCRSRQVRRRPRYR